MRLRPGPGRRRDHLGLALLDVLLGMAIFALIVVIGIQSFSKFRERAAVTQAASDAKQVATGLEALLTEPGKTTTDIPTGELDAGQLVDLGVRLTAGSRATVQRTGDTFDACVQNDAAYAWYRGAAGAIVDTGKTKDGPTCASTAGVQAPGGAVPPAPGADDTSGPSALPAHVDSTNAGPSDVVSRDLLIQVNFGEELVSTHGGERDFTVTSAGGATEGTGGHPGGDLSKYEFRPNTSWKANTVYTVRMSGWKTKAGVAVPDSSWTFRTVDEHFQLVSKTPSVEHPFLMMGDITLQLTDPADAAAAKITVTGPSGQVAMQPRAATTATVLTWLHPDRGFAAGRYTVTVSDLRSADGKHTLPDQTWSFTSDGMRATFP